MRNRFSEIFFAVLDNSLIFRTKNFTPYTCFSAHPSAPSQIHPQYYGCLDLARAYVVHT